MQKSPRLAAVAVAAGLAVALSGCASSEQPATAPPASAAPAPAPAPSAGQGVTQISDIYGPACAQVPTSGEGSAQGMVDDPVGTAASNNPLLSTLTQAVTAAGLVDTLNDPSASYTVFAPAGRRRP